MAHLEQRDFLSRVKKLFPENFFSVKVLDIGSFNVNGTERDFFSNADITGLDIAEGECVDVVCPAQDYDAPDGSFDTIISCECWEHNPYYKESILNALRMLKSGGLFVFTCATTGRAVHGVPELEAEAKENNENWTTMPNVLTELWDNTYYKNVTISDIEEIIDLHEVFSRYTFEVEVNHGDLYFWGVKK